LPAYLKGIRDYVDLAAIRRSRFKVLVDAMHGVGDRITERLAGGGRCRIETLHGDPDPLFGGHAPEPILQHLTELSRELRRRRWDIGLATDGDADRIGAVAPNGMFLNPGILLCILLEHLMKTRRWQGAVVKTISNTSMIDRMARSLNLPLMEVPVGFKHVAKLMLEDNVLIGGEESGGIGIRGYLPERDGILMGLMVLEAMAAQGKGIPAILKSLERRFGAWRYARRDLTLRPEQVGRFFERLGSSPPSTIAGIPVADIKTLDGVKLIARDESWLLFRRSGTEPIVRVYAEGLALARVKRLLDFGVGLIRSS
jgi:phosphomannomutase